MLMSALIRIVESCAQRRWRALLVGTLLAAIAATYDVAFRFPQIPRDVLILLTQGRFVMSTIKPTTRDNQTVALLDNPGVASSVAENGAGEGAP
jgi:uncharacterized membrane protein YczE